MFQLFDYYSASRIVLVVAFFECVVVAYIYGMLVWVIPVNRNPYTCHRDYIISLLEFCVPIGEMRNFLTARLTKLK